LTCQPLPSPANLVAATESETKLVEGELTIPVGIHCSQQLFGGPLELSRRGDPTTQLG
jgi:hypothetical protein